MDEKYKYLVDEGYKFEFVKYFTDAWEVYKKSVGWIILFFLILFVIYLGFGFLSLILATAGTVGQILGQGINFLSQLAQYIFIAGVYVFLRNLMKNKPKFSDFFAGFRYTGNILGHYFLYVLFTIPLGLMALSAIIPFKFIGDLFNGNFISDGNPFSHLNSIAQSFHDQMGIMLCGGFLVFCGAIYLAASYQFSIPLIVDGKLSIWKAMETSRKVVGKRFFWYILFYLAFGLATATIIGLPLIGIFNGGTVATILGVLAMTIFVIIVVYPYFLCLQFSLYDQILKPTKEEDHSLLDSFGVPIKDQNMESNSTKGHFES